MCDCYYHKCYFCDKTLPVHLGGYDTAREEIDVFCEDHLPAKGEAFIWEFSESERSRKRQKMAIRVKTIFAYKERDNIPNAFNTRPISKQKLTDEIKQSRGGYGKCSGFLYEALKDNGINKKLKGTICGFLDHPDTFLDYVGEASLPDECPCYCGRYKYDEEYRRIRVGRK